MHHILVGHCSAQNCKKLHTAQSFKHIRIPPSTPSTPCCFGKVANIIKEHLHPRHFPLLTYPIGQEVQKLENIYIQVQEQLLTRCCQTIEWTSYKLMFSLQSPNPPHCGCITSFYLHVLCSYNTIICTLVVFSF